MRKIVLFTLVLLGTISLSAQDTKLSTRAAILLYQMRDAKCTMDKLADDYSFVLCNGEPCVLAFATVADGVDDKALGTYGVRRISTVKGMSTVLIPAARFVEVVASGVCSYVGLGEKRRPQLDRVRNELGLDYIHRGINMPQGYDGTGVVVGIIDIGIEFGHPSFYDTTGTELRVKRVWKQLDAMGVPPAGFLYGSEYATTEAILAAERDVSEEGHGTHVAGIAAGCGAPDGDGRSYRGVAPNADIVLVGSSLEDAGIFDGIRYIHQYARSVGKPCVINMSLGSSIIMHDGNDDLDAWIMNYLQNPTLDSIVCVVSAGNEADIPSHLHYQFSDTDTVARTFWKDAALSNFSLPSIFLGEEGDTFSVQLVAYDRQTMTVDTVMPVVVSCVDTVFSTQIELSNDNVYTLDVTVVSSNARNNRPSIFLWLKKPGVRGGSDLFELVVRSNSANVHVWSQDGYFNGMAGTPDLYGDNEYTISGVGANTDAVISVGSYATRTRYLTEEGNIRTYSLVEDGDISKFSSHGPTLDGRVKPDICAPGQYILSSLNTAYVPDYPASHVCDSTVFNGRTYYYALMQGTSMAAPVMTGVAALWLQQNPGLNVDSVRAILHASGRSDGFTGTIPATGSNVWGWGKVDAFAGLPASSVPMYYLSVAPTNLSMGYVLGGGRHPQGQHTIEAFAASNYRFMQWSDGNTDNPRVVNLASDTNLMAMFWYDDCDTITQFPWSAELTPDGTHCWDKFSENGELGWVILQGYAVSMESDPENINWLVTPHVVPTDQTVMVYVARGRVDDSLAIHVIDENYDTVQLSDIHLALGDSVMNTVGLSAYAGHPVRLAFRHHAPVGMGMIDLNSVRFEERLGIGEVEAPGYRVATDGLRLTVSAAEGRLNVYDVIGRCVLSSPSANGSYTMPAPGVYVLRVGQSVARKVVVR